MTTANFSRVYRGTGGNEVKTCLVHGCLLDVRSLFRCDRAAPFLRIGGCLVRTSCIAAAGLALQAFSGSLDHCVLVCLKVQGVIYDRSDQWIKKGSRG